MPHLGERQRRVLTGAMGEALGRGGQKFVTEVSGISTSTMWKAVREVTSVRTIIELISATTTRTGLTVQADYDPNWYSTGVKISNTQLAAIPLTRHHWYGDWNYTIGPA